MYSVSAKLNKENKPEQGYFYFVTGDVSEKKLTNVVLTDMSGVNRMVLDKGGKPVVNALANARTIADDAASMATLAVGEDGFVMTRSQMGISSTYTYAGVTVGGKDYAVDQNGIVLMTPGLVYITRRIAYQYPGGTSYSTSTGIANVGKNGVLTVNALAKVTINGQTFDAYFNLYGFNNSGNSTIIFKGKAYRQEYQYTQHVEGYNYGNSIYVIFRPNRAGWHDHDNNNNYFYVNGNRSGYYFNKDGSIKTGWVTAPDGGRQYFMLQTYSYGNGTVQGSVQPLYSSYMSQCTIWKIGGKTYLFDYFGKMHFGWVYIKQGTIAEVGKNGVNPVGPITDSLMYFDLKSGAALTGGWKNAFVPVVLADGISYGEEDLIYSSSEPNGEGYYDSMPALPVNASAKTAKLYFNADGSLLRDTTQVIGKKLYKFAPDGTSTLSTGWLDAGKTQYMLKNGTLAVGRQKIDNVFYFFDGMGLKQTNALRRSGKAWYYYGASGAQETPAGGLFADVSAAVMPIWNKDGSLAKVVYVNSGSPAAGETVRFGPYTGDPAEDSLYVLDSKGLPMTGFVTGRFSDGELFFSAVINEDGSRFRTSGDGAALVSAGGKLYAMEGGLVVTDMEYVEISDWSLLSAADQKSMELYLRLLNMNSSGEPYEGVQVMLHPDGSVAANEIVDYEFEGPFHTGRLGVPMELISPIFKFNGKWYSNVSYSMTLGDYTTGNMLSGVFAAKENGELIGVLNSATGERLSGPYAILSGSSSSIVINLENGLPKPGTIKLAYASGASVKIDEDLGVGLIGLT